ncbi:carbohydrate ABC transporter permease, partial [bacterium]|nr:carbohydrate ABC transporter permease [bacterium]
MTPRTTIGRLVVYALLLGLAAVFLFPLLWLVATSLKPIEQTMSMPPTWLPRAHYATVDGRRLEVTVDHRVGDQPGDRWHVTERSPTKVRPQPLASAVVPADQIETRIQPRWENYRIALATMGGRSIEEAEGSGPARETGVSLDRHVSFAIFLRNTLVVCILGVIGAVFSNAIIAYGLAKVRWRGRETLFALTLATMMVPFPVTMIPTFLIMGKLHLLDTHLALILPGVIGAYGIFLIRQFVNAIPDDLFAAARIDGCSELRIFSTIVVPSCKPVMFATALFTFLTTWNDMLWPLILLQTQEKYTLP